MTDLGPAIRSEWTKLRTLRSFFWYIGLYAVISIGLGAVLASTALDHTRGRSPVTAGVWYHGLEAGQVLFIILAAQVAASEFSTGTINTTLAVTPNRRIVLLSKAITVVSVSVVVGVLTTVVTVFAAQPTLHSHGESASPTAPAVWAGIALAVLGVTSTALIGLALGLLIRHTAGATAAVAVLMLGIAAIAAALPASLRTASKFIPPQPEFGVLTPSGDYLSRGPATALLLGYTAVLLTFAAVHFQRRDA